jgi:hypothetical protein
MPRSNKNFFWAALSLLASIFGRRRTTPPSPPRPTPPSFDPDEPALVTESKVLVIVYDPVVEAQNPRTLSNYLGWPQVEDLASGFISDISQYSHGKANYRVVERINVDEFPPKVDGFRYTPEQYLDVLRGKYTPYQPQEVDYYAILAEFDLLRRVAKGEIDEVWIFGFPHAGFYESLMAGPKAFWCNAPALKNTEASRRRFILMGFSLERGVGEMLESFGHRTESILEKTFAPAHGEANLWERFSRYDKIAPGRAALGNIHFAPNSEKDYDWNNPAPVRSECFDWLLNFPNFQGDVREVTARDWGNGEMRLHHRWWLNHIPHTVGRQNGILNNWWPYILKPDLVSV